MENEMIISNNEIMGIPENSLLIPDDLYEIVNIRDIFNHQQSAADVVLRKVTDVVTDSSIGETIKKGMKKDFRYVVNMTDEMKQAIDSGAIKLDQNKAGEIFAQIRDATGQFGDKIPISKEMIAAGINPMEISHALQMKALQRKLDEMMNVLDEIGQDVAEVIQGQQNDRIGLYNSGLCLYLESRNIQDPSLRSLIVAQALKTLSDGNEQIKQEMRSSIQYLLEGRYKKNKGKSSEDIQEKMANINKCFDIVHRSYLLKSSIYSERNEIQAMLSALDQYGKFLKHEIIPIAPKLTEFDKNDVLLQDGRWDTRAKLFDSISTVRQQIAGTQTYYIGIEGEQNGKRQEIQRLPEF